METMYGWSRVNVKFEPRSLACTQTLFYFSFRSFRKHRWAHELSKRARTSVEREKDSSSSTPTPSCWRSINPLRFIFYHARSTWRESRGSVNRLLARFHAFPLFYSRTLSLRTYVRTRKFYVVCKLKLCYGGNQPLVVKGLKMIKKCEKEQGCKMCRCPRF